MRFLALIALTAGLAGLADTAPAQAPSPDTADAAMPSKATASAKAVVELFTSQGCSSCPNADAVLGKLANRDDVIALSLPVDYWDYLGWKDTLASPKFSERQRAYAHTRGDGAIYTPQVGRERPGPRQRRRRELDRAHDREDRQDGGDRLRGACGCRRTRSGWSWRPERRRPGMPAKEATLWLAVIAANVTVPIARGENQGKTVTYNNVVRELMPIGMWNGKPMTVQLERHSFMRPDADRCAVFLQQGNAGPIVGAALLPHC